MPVIPFRNCRAHAAALGQTRVGWMVERIDAIWADPNLLFAAMREQTVPLDLDACVHLAWVRRHLQGQPVREDGDYRTCLRSLIRNFDVVVLRKAALDYENPTIGGQGEPA